MRRQNWKTTFQAGTFASQDLRTHKIHRDLLSYLTFKTHQALRVCWSSQSEMAQVLNCSVRNVHGLLVYLEKIGAIYSTPFSHLPKKHQEIIRALTPNKATANAKVYYLCEQWAKDELSSGEIIDRKTGDLPISDEDKAAGRQKGNDRRRRYPPVQSELARDVEANPALDEWQFMNAVDAWSGSPTSAPVDAWSGSPTTDMSIDNTADRTADFERESAGPSSSKAKNALPVISWTRLEITGTNQHGYGAGEASALGQGTKFLVGLGEAHERPEYDAARARKGGGV